MESGNDEAVTVNTRALIDKVLARYSGEWTVLRELLQNAADAGATSVKISFETIPSATVPVPPYSEDPSAALKHVLAHHTLHRLVINNNGQPFSRTDWDRLKRIAEGNPDETKIGAFGVGFYSVFADCEEPFVSSGGEAMGFFWKGNSLHTRYLKLDDANTSSDTNFVLDYRSKTSSVPPLLPLCQFLANSLTFVGIETIKLSVDSYEILNLSKKVAPSVAIPIPKDIERRTQDGLMNVTSVSREVAQLDGTWMNAVGWKAPATSKSNIEGISRSENSSLKTFFSRLAGNTEKKEEKPKAPPIPEDITKTSSLTVFLHVHTASIQTTVSKSFSQELERATKKPPPKTTKLAVLTSPYAAPPAYNEGVRNASLDVFATVLPSKAGRIFIGFPTHQTTGLNAHISAPSVIPTVERESIDLNARYVRTWNQELLRAAGIVCRISWSAEMMLLKSNLDKVVQRAGKSKARKEEVQVVVPEAVHTANQYDFRESTPSSQVGELLERAFWTCNTTASISVLSTCGVLDSHQVRIAPKDLSFMEGIPTLPEQFAEGAKNFVRRLMDFGLLLDITVTDIKRELENSPLTVSQLMEFLKWLSKRAMLAEIDKAMVRTLLNVAVVNDEDADGKVSGVLVMSQYRGYVNASRIPPELPVPQSVLPFKYTKTLSKEQLVVLGFEELDIVPWVLWLVSNCSDRKTLAAEQDITKSAPFAGQVLPILSRHWDTLSASSREQLVALLETRTVIPTKLGMRQPPQTYFQSVKLFDDLPTVTGLNNVKEKFLGALGVRKTVELSLIFQRLLNEPQGTDSKGRSNHVTLIRYLASVHADIPARDIERLKQTAFCTAEASGNATWREGQRFMVKDLFEPDQSLRELRLPILEWPGIFREHQSEGQFLRMLGLRRCPTVTELTQIMRDAALKDDRDLRTQAMGYFLINYDKHGYGVTDLSKSNLPFLPIQGKSKMAAPTECYTDDSAAFFGFDMLQRELHPHAKKLGVKPHPPIADCVNVFLKTPPTSRSEARTYFKYFSGRLLELTPNLCERIAAAKVVPIVAKSEDGEKRPLTRLVAPQNCYLGQSELYSEIFDFVDFGEDGNLFLLKVGSKHEPTTIEVAHMLVQRPAEVLGLSRTAENYLTLLRTLASQVHVLKKDRTLYSMLKRTRFLLATKTASQPSGVKGKEKDLIDLDSDDDDYDDQAQVEIVLADASEVVLVDEPRAYNQFRHHLLAAPQENLLETFYEGLGARPLSALVEEKVRSGEPSRDQRPAAKLQKQILERSRLFLHEVPSDRIKYDTKWLEKNMQVQVVRSLQVQRSLRGLGLSQIENRTAAVIQNRSWTLCITEKSYDMHHVSEALVHFLLKRPSLSSPLSLEMLLKTDLLELRNRGYNVDRILRHKAAETRIAEEQRRKQLEAERQAEAARQLEQKSAATAAGAAGAAAGALSTKSPEAASSSDKTSNMPGVFPDSPDRSLTQHDNRPNPLESAFNFFRDNARDRMQSLLGNNNADSDPNAPPPPYQNDPGRGPLALPPSTGGAGLVPTDATANLKDAIKATKPHNARSVQSRDTIRDVAESKTYCDENHGQDIALTGKTDHNIPVYLAKKLLPSKSAYMLENSGGMAAFANVLQACADIYGVESNCVHIFVDNEGRTVAFNQGGSLFFNYRYFKEQHLQSELVGDAIVYWFVIWAHELAHNLVGPHNSEHGYYT